MSCAGQARSEQSQTMTPQRELAAALRADQLILHFQPIVSLASGAIRGVEALVRWRLPDGTELLPDDFLPGIEHTPVMHLLTRWVIETACAQAALWEPWTVSINIAAVDAVDPALVDLVDNALRANGLRPDRLTVELTEHDAVQGLESAITVLDRLRSLGVGVALDDFGTGYSSLLYLRDLPVTEVKVDRTFVVGVDRNDDDAAIVHSIVQLARVVGLSVVAEGVETAEQARYLRGIGCACAQGFRYARPAPAAEVPRTLSPQLFDPYPSQPRQPRRKTEAVPRATIARMQALVAEGASLHTIAAALNREGVATGAGLRWTGATVARALRDNAPVQARE
jgi:diguanylate cyclase